MQQIQKVCLRAMLSVCCLGLGLSLLAFDAWAGESMQLPVPGTVTMVDLGAKKCVPCKMMAPILEALEKEYKDRAAIVFIDVWENSEAAQKFGIRVIPTQIFFDTGGKEILRHEGFMKKDAIIAELTKLGVK
jgi:thioredoxin 1